MPRTEALANLSSYLSRYAGVAERAGMASVFEGSREVEVIERVPQLTLGARFDVFEGTNEGTAAATRPNSCSESG